MRLLRQQQTSNIHIIGIPEGEVRQKEAENLFKERIAKKFLKIGKGNRHPSPGNTESFKPVEQK